MKVNRWAAATVTAACVAGVTMAAQAQPAGSAKAVFDAAAAARFANLALACAHQEYPNKIAHVMTSDADVKPPRELTPAFFGCYDWHSSVHGHWLLARLARLFPDAPFAPRARAELAKSFTTENMAAEASYLAGPGRTSFERPYGLAWLLQLAAELREWKDPQAQQWAAASRPARDGRRRAPEGMAAEALAPDPDRRARPDRLRVRPRARLGAHGRRSTDDRSDPVEDGASSTATISACPLNYEPNGQDFLSACIAEADLMRRVLAPPAFADWLRAFLPQIPADGSAAWLEPVVVTDPTDPKLAHLDGLNLSRAWMLDGIVSGLPAGDARRASLQAAADRHRVAGLKAVTGEHYEGGHWLGSFAVYLSSGRGLRAGSGAAR